MNHSKLHLGSGHLYWPGFVNVDYVGDADVICDVTDLSEWQDGSVDEVHAIHLFEHLDRLKAPETLKEWSRVLKPGGILCIEVPDLEKIAKLIVNGERRARLTSLGIFGDIRLNNPWMLHKWCYFPEELKALMEEAGLETTVLPPVYHLEQRDMRLEGVKK